MARYAYVSRQFLQLFGSMPKSDMDQLDTDAATIFGVATLDLALFGTDGIAITVSAQFDEKLTKRYVTPIGVDPGTGTFSLDDVPLGVKSRVCDIVMFHLWTKRGFNPASVQDQQAIIDAKDAAWKWLDEAADSEKGFIELPRRAITPDIADVSKAGPRSYSEQSPYVAFDQQGKAGREDDGRRRGS